LTIILLAAITVSTFPSSLHLELRGYTQVSQVVLACNTELFYFDSISKTEFLWRAWRSLAASN
jgi:hypothetical protein